MNNTVNIFELIRNGNDTVMNILYGINSSMWDNITNKSICSILSWFVFIIGGIIGYSILAWITILASMYKVGNWLINRFYKT